MTAGTPAAEAALVQIPYLGLAAMLFVIAVVFTLLRLPAVGAGERAAAAVDRPAESLWSHRHLMLGVVAIFVYVGGEVAIGSLLVNFMADPGIGALPEDVAGEYLSYYWGGAMVGRFVGALVMWFVRPGRVLAFNAAAAVVLLVVAMVDGGRDRDVERARDRPLQLDHVSDDLRARAHGPRQAHGRGLRACFAWRSSGARSCP